MKLKVVSNGKHFRIKAKCLFWWYNPGYPTYNSFDAAQKVVDEIIDYLNGQEKFHAEQRKNLEEQWNKIEKGKLN